MAYQMRQKNREVAVAPSVQVFNGCPSILCPLTVQRKVGNTVFIKKNGIQNICVFRGVSK